MFKFYKGLLPAVLLAAALSADALPLRPKQGPSELSPAEKFALQATPDANPLLKQRRGAMGSALSPFTSKLVPGAMNAAARRQAPSPFKAIAGLKGQLMGCIVWEPDWVYFDAIGIYTLPEKNVVELGVNANDGGVYVNGRYYCAFLDQMFGIVNGSYAWVYDTYDWSIIKEEQAAPFDIIGFNMAHDPTDTDPNRVYGQFYSSDLRDFEFGTIDIETMTRTSTICRMPSQTAAMGFDSQGQLYAMYVDGKLVKIDKTTGREEVVRHTGLRSNWYTSGTVDPLTNTMYCARSLDGLEDALYKINLSTYEVTFIQDIDAQVTGMFIMPAEAEDNAPDRTTDLRARFDNGSLSGTVSFTAPTNTYSGGTLSGQMDYTVLADGNVVASGKVNPGQSVEANITMEAAGRYTFEACCSNSAGRGPLGERFTIWVGPDAPKAPENVNAIYANGKVTVSWNAVTESAINKSGIDASKIVYNVTRNVLGSDPVVVATGISATTFDDAITAIDGRLQVVTYSVVASYENSLSESGVSTKVYVGAEPTPYAIAFNNPNCLDAYTIEDSNGDFYNWYYHAFYGGVYITYNPDIDMNDWLFTPPVRLEAGKNYDFTLKAHAYHSQIPERFEVKLGTANNSEDMTQTVIPVTTLTGSHDQNFTATVTVSQTGDYFFGVHGMSYAYKEAIVLTGLEISGAYLPGAPDVVTGVSITGQYDGSAAAHITFTTPTKTYEGTPLSSLTKVEVRRNLQVVKTFDNPGVGVTLNFDDQVPSAGVYTYTFTAYNQLGGGKELTVNQYVGPQLAMPPTNALCVDSKDDPGVVTISWTPVARDITGAEIDPSLITYTIRDQALNIVAQDIPFAEPSYTYRAVAQDEAQSFKYYYIIPVTPAGENMVEGGFAHTYMTPVGRAYEMPFRDSFADSKTPNAWGSDPLNLSVQSEWGIGPRVSNPSCTAYDEDGGMLVWKSETGAANVGAESEFASGKIRISDSGNAAFSFYYHSTRDAAFEFVPIVKTATYTHLKGNYISSQAEGTPGWERVTISLSDYSGEDIQIGLQVKCIRSGYYFCVDNFEVRDILTNDLALTLCQIPTMVAFDGKGQIEVNVTNEGVNNATAYSVDLLCDGAVKESKQFASLPSGRTEAMNFTINAADFTTPEVKMQVRINYEPDNNMANNLSNEVTVRFVDASYPPAENLTGRSVAEGVLLEWSKPNAAAGASQVIESWEEYESWATDNVGEWTFIDVDGGRTYRWFGIMLPFESEATQGAPHAGIILDQQWITENVLHDAPENLARTGIKGLGVFNTYDNNYKDDDWIVSPELPGFAQTVTFYGRSWTRSYGYGEKMEFYYSMTSTDPSDMIRLGSDYDMPQDWRRYSYDLPEGARYFAIRCVSEDCYVMLIDDITYLAGKAARSLKGYNVYRDGVLITFEPVTDTRFVDTTAVVGATYTYHVVAVYDDGDAIESNIFSITHEESSLEGINVDDPDAEVLYFTTQGIQVKRPATGVYIVVRGGVPTKEYIK